MTQPAMQGEKTVKQGSERPG